MPAKTSRGLEGVLRQPRVIGSAIALIAVLGGVAIARRSSPDSKPATEATAKKSNNFSADAWPAGVLATYQIAWKSDADVVVDVASVKRQTKDDSAAEARAQGQEQQQGKLATHLHVEGELTLRRTVRVMARW